MNCFLKLFAGLLSLFLTIGDLAFACNYGPFELEVRTRPPAVLTRSSKAAPALASTAPLQFASAVIQDASFVHSDAPFIEFPAYGTYMVWRLDTSTDARLASENTMLEIFGIYERIIGRNAAMPLLTQGAMEAFEGVTSADFLSYPRSMRNQKIEDVTRRFLGADAATQFLNGLRARNTDGEAFRDEYGLAYFSRPSFLTSGNAQSQYGVGVMFACMALGYGRDRYSNPDPEIRGLLGGLPYEIIRSSILDMMAAEALTRYQATEGKEINRSVELLGGKVKCDLVESNEYIVSPIVPGKCVAVVQQSPVIRRASDDDRVVQVGDKLYEATCDFDGKRLPLSQPETGVNARSEQLLNFMVANDPKGGESEFGRSFRGALSGIFSREGSLELASQVESTVASCDSALTGSQIPSGTSGDDDDDKDKDKGG